MKRGLPIPRPHTLLWVLTWILLGSPGLLGQRPPTLEKRLEQLMLEDKVQRARELLGDAVEEKGRIGDYGGLAKLVYWVGKLELVDQGGSGFPKARKLADTILESTRDGLTLYHTHSNLAKLHNEEGNAGKAFDSGIHALESARALEDPVILADIHYGLGEYALRSGDMDHFGKHTRSAHKFILRHPEKEFSNAARVLNYMGALMYLTQKPDSASFHYERALDNLGLLEDNPENRLYFPAAIKANMVLLEQQQNRYETAMQLAKECIVLNNRFLELEKHPLRYRAQRNLSLAYRNLSSLYHQVGDYEKANHVAQIAYGHAKKTFNPQVQEYFSGISLLAETKISIRDFKGAIELLEEARASLEAMDGDNYLHKANLYGILGNVFYGEGKYDRAKEHYLESKAHYELAQMGAPSSDHLFVLINLGLTHAYLGQGDRSLDLLERTHVGLVQNASGENRHTLALKTAISRAYFLLGDYANCLEWTDRFLAVNQGPSLDADQYKPEILLLKAKAKYHQQAKPDTVLLKELDRIMDVSLGILDEKKSLLATSQNVGQLVEEHREIFDFAKLLNLELHQKTSDPSRLTKTLQLHESSIYNRIRSRLNLKSRSSYLNVPDSVLKRGDDLRANLSMVQGESGLVAQLQAWKDHLTFLQKKYPHYHKMRYGNLIVPWEDLRTNLPETTSLVRYFFIGDQLYAFVANASGNILRALDFEPVRGHIQVLASLEHGISEVSKAAFELHRALWDPIKDNIGTENVIIFPDRELFNLSFGLLTHTQIASYGDFARYSLLAKHNLSYNYSLLVIDREDRVLDYDNDFISFAPEFNSQMKLDYRLAITDSLDLDKTYLTLLPQPFHSDVAKRFSRIFDGPTFLNEHASKQLFSNRAKEHKIIHIATHAESNNGNPGLSRLVFAKNTLDSLNINDNYLYAHEIYNNNLSSNLAILTACETGKPTYQPGEGMISLAHAFNYAGSESILTSLWQIDEKSSSEILAFFYHYLSQGEPKDRAIRLAQLDYLGQARGRTQHPQYWAGLILMGETAPVELHRSKDWMPWALATLVVLVMVYLLIQKGKAPK